LPTRASRPAAKASSRATPSQAGVEGLFFNGFSVGTNPFSLAQVNSNYDLSDSITRTLGLCLAKTAIYR